MGAKKDIQIKQTTKRTSTKIKYLEEVNRDENAG